MSRNRLGQKLTLAGAVLLTTALAPVQALSQNTALIPARTCSAAWRKLAQNWS